MRSNVATPALVQLLDGQSRVAVLRPLLARCRKRGGVGARHAEQLVRGADVRGGAQVPSGVGPERNPDRRFRTPDVSLPSVASTCGTTFVSGLPTRGGSIEMIPFARHVRAEIEPDGLVQRCGTATPAIVGNFRRASATSWPRRSAGIAQAGGCASFSSHCCMATSSARIPTCSRWRSTRSARAPSRAGRPGPCDPPAKTYIRVFGSGMTLRLPSSVGRGTRRDRNTRGPRVGLEDARQHAEPARARQESLNTPGLGDSVCSRSLNGKMSVG